ncbi:hypothetical protein SAMN05216579_1564 [Pseudomonas granadensis]|nr:hypothetical protein SAMN05216579_1564 [Pseudomonas granadensis]
MNIRFFGCCGWRFRPYGEALFPNAEKVPKKAWPRRTALAGSGSFAPGPIRAQRLRFAALHLLPLCLATPDGRYAPTPGSIPPLSLPKGPARQDQEHSSLRSLYEWWGAGVWVGCWGLVWCGRFMVMNADYRFVRAGSADQKPLTLALSQGERELTVVDARTTPTCDTESNANFERRADRLPLPPGEGWGEGQPHHNPKANHPLLTTQQ